MKLHLIQPIQNKLYDFKRRTELSKAESVRLADETVRQTLSICEGAESGDLIVTTEAQNYAGHLCGDKETLINCIKPNQERYIFAFSKLAKSKNAYLVAGLMNVRSGEIYNSAFVFDRSGEIEGIYDKINLAGSENILLRRGTSPFVFKADGLSVGTLICYDMQFPETVQKTVAAGADIIVCPTWGWEDSYVKKRAEETGTILAGAMSLPYNQPLPPQRTPSSVYDGKGGVLVCGSRKSAGIVSYDLSN